jgi:hypothetical protein
VIGSLGDFQTPRALADRVMAILKASGINPQVIIEPTCGSGNLIVSALDTFPEIEQVYSVELQPRHEREFWKAMGDWPDRITIEYHVDDAFVHEFPVDQFAGKQVLVLGNPPWVTNSAMGATEKFNLPRKENFKHVRGIEALTGKGNFDIAESIILRVARQVESLSPEIAFLCKITVCRNIVRDAHVLDLPVTSSRMFTFDARKAFGVAAAGALFTARLGIGSVETCKVSSIDTPDEIERSFGWVNDRFVSDCALYQKSNAIAGRCHVEWRQGLKHDAAKIFILKSDDVCGFVNGIGEHVEIESLILYPFVRGTDLKASMITSTDASCIVTQHHLGEDTTWIASECPLAWQYLAAHKQSLDARKSSMYRGKPPFSMFGIGEYAFTPYKVAIAGFAKEQTFSLVLPLGGKPAMLDDTCYFLPFPEIGPALIAFHALNMPITREYLASVSFPEGKRVTTKEILMGLDIVKLLDLASPEEIEANIAAISEKLARTGEIFDVAATTREGFRWFREGPKIHLVDLVPDKI